MIDCGFVGVSEVADLRTEEDVCCQVGIREVRAVVEEDLYI